MEQFHAHGRCAGDAFGNFDHPSARQRVALTATLGTTGGSGATFSGEAGVKALLVVDMVNDS
jgi:hypothetical protein